jgi:hypothetical protein
MPTAADRVRVPRFLINLRVSFRRSRGQEVNALSPQLVVGGHYEYPPKNGNSPGSVNGYLR